MAGRKRSGTTRKPRNPEEELIARTTESILEAMRRKGVTKAELARRLGTTNAYITQLLSGDRNLTLRTIAAVAEALNVSPRLSLLEND